MRTLLIAAAALLLGALTPAAACEATALLRTMESRIDRVQNMSVRRELAVEFSRAEPKHRLAHETQDARLMRSSLRDVQAIDKRLKALGL